MALHRDYDSPLWEKLFDQILSLDIEVLRNQEGALMFHNSIDASCSDIIMENEGTQDPKIIANIEHAQKVLDYLSTNFVAILHRHNSLYYGVTKFSKAVKFCHYLLTSPELGY